MADRINYEVNFSATGAQALWNEYIAGGESAGRALNQALGGRVKKELFLEVKTDDSGVKKLVAGEREVYTELQKIINLQEKANKTQQGSVTSLRQQVNEAKQARDGMAKYASSADGLNTKLGTINGAWAAQNQRVKDLQRQLDIAGASNVWQKLAAEYNLKGLAGAGRQITELVNIFQSVSIIVGQVIGSVNQLFDALQRVQSIKLTFQGIGAGGDIGAVFSESSRIALGLGVNLNTVRDAFQQLSPVILATGGNIGDVSAITESLSSRFVTFGLSADKSRRVMNGVVQAFSKGKLMAEELTQQISEADPAFRTDLANAIGVSVKKLGEMVKAGEITNAVLLEAIPRMSKASGLFGKLGSTALDAAAGFRQGAVTVEQFRAQLGNIEQLALEDLINPDTGPLQPLLASLAELRAVLTDVAVAFARSEAFESFLRVLGALASQISLVIQTIVKIISTIASIAQPIFGAINAIDSLGGTLKGVGVISTIVAGIITTKLIVAIYNLAGSAVIGAAMGGLNLLSRAITLLGSGAILNLIKTIGSSIVAFIGLGAATTKTAIAEGAATVATRARTVASKLLTGQLLQQAAAEKLLGSTPGGPGGGGPVITQGRGVQANPAKPGPGFIGPVPPPPNAQKAAADAAKAATQTNKWSQAVKTLVQSIKAIPLNPYTAVAATLATATVATISYTQANKSASGGTKAFDSELKRLKEAAKAAKENIAITGNESLTFDERLKNVQRTVGGLDWKNITPGFDLFSGTTIKYSELIQQAKQYLSTVAKETQSAQTAVANYNKENDKSGIQGKKIAQDIAVAEGLVSTALEITKAKRAEMIAEAEKAGPKAKKINLAQIAAYDREIKKLEEQKEAINRTKKEAEGKDIVIPVKTDTTEAVNGLAGIEEKAKALKVLIAVEGDPAKREKLQGELNGLEGQLKYLQADPVEIKIDAEFKINQRALQDAVGISQAVEDNLSAAVTYAQSLFGLRAAYVTGAEKTGQKELDTLNDRLDKEKEIRQERITAAEEAGASEGQLKSMKEEDRKADKAGRDAVKAKEEELAKLAEKKRQIEIEAIRGKLAALPAQQAAERQSLVLQQKLNALELERLAAASKRARLEAEGRRVDIGKEISTAVAKGDTKEEERLRKLYNLQSNYIKLLDQEAVSLEKSKSAQSEINSYQLQSLGYKQAAQTTDLQAQLAQENALSNAQQTTTAVRNTGAAMANTAQNAAAFTKASQDAAQYEQSGAAEARRQADAKDDAAAAGQRAADSAKRTAEQTGEANDATDDSVKPTQSLEDNLEGGANAAGEIADTLTALDGKTITVNVNYTGQKGLWTGGPTVSGETYRINELGQEGFLSAGGTLSPINKPRNALWRAPSKGMVIPAHIMSNLNIPTGRVSTGVRPATVATGGNGLSRIARAIQNALLQTGKSDPGLHEMAAVQAHQAQQIGKLSRAVTKLADKDWNVNVGVRNSGSTAYLDALNRRM